MRIGFHEVGHLVGRALGGVHVNVGVLKGRVALGASLAKLPGMVWGRST